MNAFDKAIIEFVNQYSQQSVIIDKRVFRRNDGTK
jgi:hypothetical protein